MEGKPLQKELVIKKLNICSMALPMEGKKAPAFKAVDQNGDPIALTDYLGKKVVLFFYPKDDTPTCTTQACNLRDNYAKLKGEGFEVIGVSVDSVKSHKKFEQKHHLPYRLVSDEKHKIVTKYGIWGQKQMMGHTFMGTFRTTYLIDEKGKIRKILNKPVSKSHADEILAAWKTI